MNRAVDIDIFPTVASHKSDGCASKTLVGAYDAGIAVVVASSSYLLEA